LSGEVYYVCGQLAQSCCIIGPPVKKVILAPPRERVPPFSIYYVDTNLLKALRISTKLAL